MNVNNVNFLKKSICFATCFFINIATVPGAAAEVVKKVSLQAKLGNDEETFIFAGRCPNNQIYRISSYELIVDGVPQSFYDYEGPVGKGTAKTNASPKTMAVRVCRELAEIASTSKHD